MRKRQSRLLDESASEPFWPAFTDVVSTIALILFVLVLLAYLQNLLSGKKLSQIQSELSLTARRLGDSQTKISHSEKQLRMLKQQIQSTMAEIKSGEIQLRLSEEKVAHQEEIIAQSNLELGELRGRLQGIAVLRMDVIRKVKEAIEEEIDNTPGGAQPNISIAENGNIIINESLMFEYNSYEIKPEGRPLLDKLSKAFAGILADDAVAQNVDVVLIQGHTDDRGSAAFNRDLSAKRSNAVLDYMFSAVPTLESRFGRYFASSAYSKFRPVSKEKNERAYQKNRRIEVSVVLKDAHIQNVIDDYMAKQPLSATDTTEALSIP